MPDEELCVCMHVTSLSPFVIHSALMLGTGIRL